MHLDFVQDDWEQELADFYRSDVFVPAKLTVDGKVYPNVGFQFRGNSSYRNLSPGQKRAFNVSIDLGIHDRDLRPGRCCRSHTVHRSSRAPL